jgi:hypothetical protein
MATTKDRLGRVPGISDPGLNLAGGLASLDTGLREGLRDKHGHDFLYAGGELRRLAMVPQDP